MAGHHVLLLDETDYKRAKLIIDNYENHRLRVTKENRDQLNNNRRRVTFPRLELKSKGVVSGFYVPPVGFSPGEMVHIIPPPGV